MLKAEVPYFEELDATILAFLSLAVHASVNFPAIESAFLYWFLLNDIFSCWNSNCNCSLFIPSDYKKPETCNPVLKKLLEFGDDNK